MEPGDEHELQAIKSSMLSGCPSCPYCGNNGAIICSCGTVICASKDMIEMKEPVICPGCNNKMSNITEDAVVDVKQTQG